MRRKARLIDIKACKEVPESKGEETRREAMPQSAWPTFTRVCRNRHLVVVEVPGDVSKDPEALVALLIDLVSPRGDFAVSAEKTAVGARLFCAFAESADADMIVQATNAQEDNVYSGWASEHHCLLDKTSAEAIRGAAAAPEPVRWSDPVRPTSV
jgi:hypothetical protein